jgi:predicted metal-dependent hydrolase
MKIKPIKQILDFGNRKIPYNLHREARKRLRIVVDPELTVDIFAPVSATDDQIQAVINKKRPWIVKTLDKLERFHPLPTPKHYLSGETFIYLGRQYRLRIENGSNGPAKLIGRYLRVHVNGKANPKSAKKYVDAWYRNRAHEILERYMEKCYSIASRHGVPDWKMTIRTMKRRWGSCSPSGRITLNLNLVMVPVHCIEYVIMHELCHLKIHNHSKAFYSLLTRCQPDWRQRKEALDKFRLI